MNCVNPFSSKRGCSRSKDPSKILFILKPLTGFNGTFLTSQNVLLGLDIVKSLPRRTENRAGEGGGEVSHRLSMLPGFRLGPQLFCLVPVLNGTRPDVGTLSSVQIRKWWISWNLGVTHTRVGQRSFQWIFHPSPCLFCECVFTQSKFSPGHRRWWRNNSFATFSTHCKKMSAVLGKLNKLPLLPALNDSISQAGHRKRKGEMPSPPSPPYLHAGTCRPKPVLNQC